MDLMTFLKKYSIKYAKKDFKKDLIMLPVGPIIINTPTTIIEYRDIIVICASSDNNKSKYCFRCSKAYRT